MNIPVIEPKGILFPSHPITTYYHGIENLPEQNFVAIKNPSYLERVTKFVTSPFISDEKLGKIVEHQGIKACPDICTKNIEELFFEADKQCNNKKSNTNTINSKNKTNSKNNKPSSNLENTEAHSLSKNLSIE
ncbi:MAG: hypothetical protein KTV77_01235 [Wolbachia endosymbiont of Fragariocoptes setiger]|nr:hypothetical protein [Wolbachia endosymbiont of Fragariocoptes setiger]